MADLRLVNLGTITPRAIRYLWKPYLPKGKLVIVAGDPGLGKSRITLDWASRVSTGASWPTGEEGTVGNVLIFSAEDDREDTMAPVLDSYGADRSRIWHENGVTVGTKTQMVALVRPDVREALEKTLEALHPDLVIIDPVNAYLGSIDTNKDVEVRAVLTPLSQMAADHGVCLVGVMHLNKANQMFAIQRTGGSMGFVGTARGVYMVLNDPRDPDDDSRRIFCPTKYSHAMMPPAIPFTIGDQIEWGAPERVKVDALLQGAWKAQGANKVDDARAFLEETLIAPKTRALLEREADLRGISTRTLRRALAAMDLKAQLVREPLTGQTLEVYALTDLGPLARGDSGAFRASETLS